MQPLSLFGHCLILGVNLASLAVASEQYNLVTSYSFPSGNLLSNGSFENNYSGFEFEGWSESIGYPPMPGNFKPLAFDNTVDPYNGRKMAAVQFISPATPIRFLASKPFPVKPNTWYTYFQQYQTDNYEPTAEADFIRPIFQTFRSRDVLPENETAEEEALETSHRNGPAYQDRSGWTGYVHRFKTGPEANVGVISLLWGLSGAAGTFYFDDAYLTEGCVKASAADPLVSGCPSSDVAIAFGKDNRHPSFIGVSRKFLNGNNNLVQTLVQDGTRDIVSHVFYDNFGRAKKNTLAIAIDLGSERHGFVPGITADNLPGDVLADYYQPLITPTPIDDKQIGQSAPSKYPDAGGYAYSEIRYEDSPLGRALEASQPGEKWKMGSGRTVVSSYSSVPDLVGNDLLEDNGQFFVKEVSKPDGQVSRDYTDKSGKLIRSSSKLGSDHWVTTNYEYDSRGNLVKTVAPAGSGGWTVPRLTSTAIYNALNQLVSDSTFAAGKTEYKYDSTGRLRFTRTANQAKTHGFSFIQYDSVGRIKRTGEIKDVLDFNGAGTKFTDAYADKFGFPCTVDCADQTSEIAPGLVFFRNLNLYDDANYKLSCDGTISSSDQGTPGNPGHPVNIRFLVEKVTGGVVATGYEIFPVYRNALEVLSGQTAGLRLLALYESGPDFEVIPEPNVEIDLVSNGLTFTIEGVSMGSPEGVSALAAFVEFEKSKTNALYGSGEYLHGRLVQSLSCNYELAQVLGESGPREVSKTFRYDKSGNVTYVSEFNEYARNAKNQRQFVRYAYDTQNRISEKWVCGDASCSAALSHVEKYQYDQLGRMSLMLDKNDAIVSKNHYNYIGQLSAQGLGGDLVPSTTTKALVQKAAYHLHGMVKNIKVDRISGPQGMFNELLGYEDGIPARYDGTISQVRYLLDPDLDTRNALEYSFKYDGLGRLTKADDITQLGNYEDKSTSTAYSDDGRIIQMGMDDKLGQYHYYDNGRLKEVTGSLVEGRNMNLLAESDTVFQYDENGNLIADSSKGRNGHPLEILYRPDNLPYLFTYRNPGSTDDFQVYMAYDASGNRISKETTRNDSWVSTKNYFSIGKEVHEADGTATGEFYGLGSVGRVSYSLVNSGGEKEFFIKDHLGSTSEVYNSHTGLLTYASLYLPYGKQFGEFHSPNHKITEKFTGKELDEGINLSYFGSRYYDADLGMWISPDPAREFHSPYAYSPNPGNSIDPDGRTTLWLAGAGNNKNSASYSIPIINKLSSAGVSDVSWLATHRSYGNVAQLMRAVATFSALNGGPLSFNVSSIIGSYSRVGGQFNLIGYSQGSAEAALGAIALANSGKFVDNVVLIASPILKSGPVYEQLMCTENIGSVQFIDIPNDAMGLNGASPTQHFYYTTNSEGQQDALVKQIVGSGVK